MNVMELYPKNYHDAKMEHVKAYYSKKYKCWCLNIEYSYKTESGEEQRLEIPAFPVPFPMADLPRIIDESALYFYTENSLDDDHVVIKFVSDTIHLFRGRIHDQKGTLMKAEGYFAVKSIPKDMTKKEIEDILGYPINIIKEDK